MDDWRGNWRGHFWHRNWHGQRYQLTILTDLADWRWYQLVEQVRSGRLIGDVDEGVVSRLTLQENDSGLDFWWAKIRLGRVDS